MVLEPSDAAMICRSSGIMLLSGKASCTVIEVSTMSAGFGIVVWGSVPVAEKTLCAGRIRCSLADHDLLHLWQGCNSAAPAASMQAS